MDTGSRKINIPEQVIETETIQREVQTFYIWPGNDHYLTFMDNKFWPSLISLLVITLIIGAIDFFFLHYIFK